MAVQPSTSRAGWVTETDLEWWQRIGVWRRGRVGKSRWTTRFLKLRSIWLWISLAWLVALALTHGELGEALSIALQGYWLLIAWFWLARTKTLSWRAVAGGYSVCLVWSFLVAFVSLRLTQQITATADPWDFANRAAIGPATMIAGIGEECAKLLPLAVLALAAPGRVRRLAVVDWLLAGFVAGLGFQIAEELARRTVAQVVKPGLLDILAGDPADRSPESGYAQYGWSPLSGWSQGTTGGVFPGHHVTTALVAGCVGLGILAWRHGAASRLGVVWRLVGLAMPLMMLWLVVSVHAGFNASDPSMYSVLSRENSPIPGVIRAGWEVAQHGVGVRWLLVVLLIAALLLDTHRLYAADTQPLNPVMGIPFHAAIRVNHWAKGNKTATWLAALVVYPWRDVRLLLLAHARESGESLRVGLARGRVCMEMQRQARAEGIARTLKPGGRWWARVVAVLAVVILLAGWLWLAPLLARQINGFMAEVPISELYGEVGDILGWFAGILESLGAWWVELPLGTKIIIGAGIAALVVLSGGSLMAGMGIAGAATYLLDHSQGAATFIRNPVAATDSYLATTTPLGMAADAAEGVLTFLPGNFTGAAGGMFVRNSIRTYARDPAAWRAMQRRLRWNDDSGIIDIDAYLRRDPLKLVDGRTWDVKTPQKIDAFTQHADQIATPVVRAPGESGEFQRYLYGDREYLVWEDPKVYADGVVPDYAAIADAKFRGQASSWNYPPSLTNSKMREFAEKEIDDSLIRYRNVLNDPDNPFEVLEIGTNDREVMTYFGSRMRELNVPGYVRLVEGY